MPKTESVNLEANHTAAWEHVDWSAGSAEITASPLEAEWPAAVDSQKVLMSVEAAVRGMRPSRSISLGRIVEMVIAQGAQSGALSESETHEFCALLYADARVRPHKDGTLSVRGRQSRGLPRPRRSAGDRDRLFSLAEARDAGRVLRGKGLDRVMYRLNKRTYQTLTRGGKPVVHLAKVHEARGLALQRALRKKTLVLC